MGVTNMAVQSSKWEATETHDVEIEAQKSFSSEEVELMAQTVVGTDKWNGAERSSAGSGDILMFNLFGSTEGSSDYSLWTQLLHELY